MLIGQMFVLLLLMLNPGSAGSAGWSVSFEDPNPCGLRGSSVLLGCSFHYPEDECVEMVEWSKGGLHGGQWVRSVLSTLTSYQGRAQYVGDKKNNCSLVIHDLQDVDHGHFYFSFRTDRFGRRSKVSVFLSVSGLTARVRPTAVALGDTVTFECGTSCGLSNVVWFKDGRPVAKPPSQVQAKDGGRYSCAVEGQEWARSHPVDLDVHYPPFNVTVVVNPGPPGPVVLLTPGSSAHLTCSSHAHPPALRYTWYRRTLSSGPGPGPGVPVGSGPVLSLSSVDSSHSGLYVCQVWNKLGENSSTEVMLMMDEADVNGLIAGVGLGVKVVLVLVLVPAVVLWRRWKCSAEDEENDHDYENTRAM
ncbi:B-cell receptor CD22-like isoform X2 [Sphaeramia orbicularis]|uniref:B-cell receptor CD22-like isoform X2 n=1 Tax=Sphaeramia orbicularis TaxID=375764 RepID=UPI001180A4AB|nr:B-cell receptor CD22-like isoform X2 [Sphaeramia orbicularis]